MRKTFVELTKLDEDDKMEYIADNIPIIKFPISKTLSVLLSGTPRSEAHFTFNFYEAL